MVVYADILICLNIVITYFILLADCKITGITVKTIRLIAASVTGGLVSLYIYLPQQHFALELIIKLLFSAVITAVAFGKSRMKAFLRALCMFYVISFLYAGFMLGFWYVFKPDRMIINNGVVYFSMSPLILVLSTVVCYYLLTFGKRLLKKENSNAGKKHIKLSFNSKTVECDCMIDTGSTVTDIIGGNKVVILDRKISDELFGCRSVETLLKMSVPDGMENRFRVLPYKTLSSSGIMPSVKIDSVTVGAVTEKNVIAGISNTSFDGDFGGIISPDF